MGLLRGFISMVHTLLLKEELWNELVAAKGLWVIGGDFNICRFKTERLNCNHISMKEFSDSIENLGLVDLPLHRPLYT